MSGEDGRPTWSPTAVTGTPPIESKTHIRVRYADTDRMGIVHHAAFLEYLEMGRVELMRDTGISYRELEARDIYYPVIEVWVRYRRSLNFDDLVQVRTWYRTVERMRVTFGYQLTDPGGEIAAEALTLHAQTDVNGRPVAISPEVRAAIEPHVIDEDPGPGRLRAPPRRG